MHGSDPLDHDPAAKDITFRDVICAVGNGSDGQDGSGAWGRRRATAGDSVCGGAALGSPEVVESDAPGVKSANARV